MTCVKLVGRAEETDKDSNALMSMLARPQRLTTISTSRARGLPPSLFTSMPLNPFEHLVTLTLSDFVIPSPLLTSLGKIIAEEKLPSLQNLKVGDSCEHGGISELMVSLQEGACPHLESLSLPFGRSSDGRGHGRRREALSVHDQAQVERDIDVAVQVLERRRMLGNCRALKWFGDAWVGRGTPGAQCLLLELLLPSLEELPEVPSGWIKEVIPILKRVGMPCLKRLSTAKSSELWYEHSHSNAYPLHTVESMMELEELTLDHITCVDLVNHVVRMIRKHKSNLLPKLKVLELLRVIDPEPLFNAVEETSAFASVQILKVGSPTEEFSLALSQGAFPNLQRLEIPQPISHVNFSSLCQALEMSPCAKTLTHLTIMFHDKSVVNMQEFGTIIAKNCLPALEELAFDGPIGATGAVAYLIESFKEIDSPLKVLSLRHTRLGDAGMKKLTWVLDEGGLKNLTKLDICGTRNLTDIGALFLSQAIWVGHLMKLKDLNLSWSNILAGGMGALAAAVLQGCPCLRGLYFPRYISAEDQGVIGDILKGKKGLYVSF